MIEASSNQVLLCICDGMGYSKNREKNAVADANTPTLDHLYNHYPFTTIIPGGESVGLPKGVAGNSEVGHMNLGAGRPVRQDLVRINEAIAKNTLEQMEKFQEIIKTAKEKSKRLHLMTLLSDGGVHSHINHLKAILEILKNYPELEIYLHAFMDGRDTPRTNGVNYLKDILSVNHFKFASMQGRSIGMDRDRRWEKIQKAYDMMTGKSCVTDEDPISYIESQYKNEVFDEFIEPMLFDKNAAIESDDCVFFLNFRPDRAKQISTVFCDKNFKEFKNDIIPTYFLCMSPYIDEELPHVPILFNREKVKNTLSEYLSSLGKKQLKIAETEKYAHVTYFFNGGEESPFSLEERILIDSPKDVATYDQKPEMSAYKVLTSLLEKLDDKSFSLYVVNFANPDMVGHTGNYEATIKAMQVIDECIKKLSDKCLENNISMLITADHGNADQMTHEDSSAHTSHSKADVPFCLVQKDLTKDKVKIRSNECALKDVAPTILKILGIKKHDMMSGESIFL